MLIENDNHYRTLDVVVRLSALYKKTWILIRLRIMKMVIIFILNMSLICDCGKPVEKIKNLWKTLRSIWKKSLRIR